MSKNGLLAIIGSGRSTTYAISPLGRILANIDAQEYLAMEPDKRYGLNYYNFDLLPAIPNEIFTDIELTALTAATSEYQKRTAGLPTGLQKKELERLIIELSWKSSKIEGNTYTLLDTEKLILENKTAVGHSREEALMILNHKKAFNYIRENLARFQTLNRRNLEELHSLIVQDLGVSLGLRTSPVGITGSIYHPLDNVHQISEAVQELSAAVTRSKTPYTRALLALAVIGYIQPFEDGNKRSGRLMANALLMADSLAPLSYRSIDEDAYRAAMLSFYELNSLMPLKKIFIEQYDFAARNYAVK